MDKLLIHPRILELRKDKNKDKINGSFKQMLKELYKKKEREYEDSKIKNNRSSQNL